MHSIIYETANFSHLYLGYFGSVLLPFAILVILVLKQFRNFSFSLPFFAVFLILFPTLTPAISGLFGYEYFTRLNYELQSDEVLKIAAVFLVSLYTIFFIIGSTVPNTIQNRGSRVKLKFPLMVVVVFVSLASLLVMVFIESGSVLTRSYGSIKLENESPFSSLVNQFFNVCVAGFLCYRGEGKRKRFILIYYLFMIAVFLVFARRTSVIGLAILVVYTFGGRRFTSKQIILLVVAAFLLLFIGEARSVGIINYIEGMRLPTAAELFFALPGGASNVFVGVMGVVDLVGSHSLKYPETFPILLWPTGTYESSIYRLFYQYNGGMHIANIFYWNFGLLGVAFGGFCTGWITMRVHKIALRLNGDMGGTLLGALSIAYILVLPNLLWYHPVGLINLSIAVYLFHILSRIFMRR